MNHENRIKSLEKEVEILKQTIKAYGFLDKFIPLSVASKKLQVNPWVIRGQIKKNPLLKLGVHYKLNGNRYLINVRQWENLIAESSKLR